MKDITHIFNATPLKNNTYLFFATIESSPFIEPYYTVHYIKNFNYKGKSNSRKSLWTSIHDIAHVIDLWEHGHPERLMMTEFGWKLTERQAQWPLQDIYKELRVTVLQSFLCQNTFGWSREREHSKWSKRELRGRCKVKGGFLPTKKEWDERVAKYRNHYENLGYEAVVRMWQEACQYVKDNR